MHRLVLIALLGVLGACSSILPTAGDLDGEWRLVSGSWEGSSIDLRDDAPITLTVDGATAGGRSACNSYFADLERNGEAVRFTGIGGTEMGCDQAVMTLEATYVAALSAVSRWRRDGDRLTLSGQDVELAYAVVVPPEDVALVGTRWQLETVERNGTASSAVDFSRVSMTFGADGTVTGAAGCTTWDGRWREESGRIEVTEVGVTVSRCASPDLASSAEEAVMGVVDGGFVAAIEASTMSVAPEGGTGLQFRAIP
jgi:heat shock protein HslJ